VNTNPELLVAFAGILTAIITGAIAWHNARHAAKKDIVEILRGEVERLTNRIILLEQERDEKAKQYNELREKVRLLEAANTRLKREINELQTENSELRNQNDSLQKRIGELEAKLGYDRV